MKSPLMMSIKATQTWIVTKIEVSEKNVHNA